MTVRSEQYPMESMETGFSHPVNHHGQIRVYTMQRMEIAFNALSTVTVRSRQFPMQRMEIVRLLSPSQPWRLDEGDTPCKEWK